MNPSLFGKALLPATLAVVIALGCSGHRNQARDNKPLVKGVDHILLTVTDMVLKRRPYRQLRFDDLVETFLVGHRAVYDSGFQVRGRLQEHTVRFHVNSDRKALIQPLSPASEPAAFSWAERWAYRFGDIKELDSTWKPFAVLDDRGERSNVWTPRCLIPLRRDATVVFWSNTSPLAEAVVGSPNR